MRIATITNWAYSATVCLTLASGIVMLMASNADTTERRAVEQRQVFDQLTEEVEIEAWSLSDLARLYVVGKDPEVLNSYRQKELALKNIEHRLSTLKDAGATGEELALLHEGLQIVDALQDEQQAALDNLARDAITDATQMSRTLRTLSEVMVGLTALLFLFVLGFILKRRVLRRVWPDGFISLTANLGRCAALSNGFHRRVALSHSIRMNVGQYAEDRAIRW